MMSVSTHRLSADHPCFDGHFPAHPIVPGVMLLDAAIYATLQMQRPPMEGSEDKASIGNICQIGSAKFLSPVGPGETLTISCTSTTSGSTQFTIASGSRKIATGTLMFPATP